MSKRPTFSRQVKCDFDDYYLEQEVATRTRQISEFRSKSIHSLKTKKSQDLQTLNRVIKRDFFYLNGLIVVGVKEENIPSFLKNNNIFVSVLEIKTLNLGHPVYFFKIVHEPTNFTWSLTKSTVDFEKFAKKLVASTKNPDFNLNLKPKSNKILFDLEDYLNKVVIDENASRLDFVYDFFEISEFHYDRNTTKHKEGFFQKRTGGNFKKKSCSAFLNRYKKKWFIILKDGILYNESPKYNDTKEFLMFDSNFKIRYGFRNTGSLKKLIVTTMTKDLKLKADSTWEMYLMIIALENAVSQCSYVQINRFISFAPQRSDNDCKPYIDGEEYFSDIFSEINRAKSEIFITDWWLSPELHLKRPSSDDSSRLDIVLKNAAEKGVKICILVYKEVSIVLPLNSYHTKKHLEKLHSNITVLRHPPSLIFLWSHHEKMVIIDQKIGFMGGLDLCFGRMDNKKHQIFDEENYWTGKDYSNCRISDFRNVVNHDECQIDKNLIPRMPWHDIAVRVKGSAVKDLTRHFIQYWNFVRTTSLLKNKNTEMTTAIPKKSNFLMKNKKKTIGLDTQKIMTDNSQPVKSPMEETKEEKIYDFIVKEVEQSTMRTKIEDSDEPRISTFDRYTWSNKDKLKLDSGVTVKLEIGETVKEKPINRLPNHFNLTPEYANALTPKENGRQHTTKKLTNLRNEIKCMDNLEESTFQIKLFDPNIKRTSTGNISSKIFHSRNRKSTINMSQSVYADPIDPFDLVEKSLLKPKVLTEEKYGTCKTQIVRSASTWSCGIASTNNENSIQIAYLQCIEESKYFIYIENQFFISGLAGTIVKNKIAEAIVYRIKLAYQNKENFKVYVVLPLLPAFEGEINDRKSSVLRIQLYWEYQTICRGGNSILERLKLEGVENPDDYVAFYGMRTHGLNKNNIPATEMVYIHSKLMIVDDEKVILGSANINDRSMNGNRDSEIGIVIEDTMKDESLMDGKKYEASFFAKKLRENIWMEHFGIEREEANDPLSDSLWDLIKQRSQKNTEIYREIFRCYPDDNISKLFEIEEFKNKANLEKYEELIQNIKGFVVDFPKKFLRDEVLRFSNLEMEYYCPEHNFT